VLEALSGFVRQGIKVTSVKEGTVDADMPVAGQTGRAYAPLVVFSPATGEIATALACPPDTWYQWVPLQQVHGSPDDEEVHT